MFRRLMLLAVVAGLPSTALAQFTTFIPPRPPAVDSVKAAVAVQQKAKTDSSVNLQLTNMKTWVDSAAGIVTPPATTSDSLAAGLTPASTATASVTPPDAPLPDSARFKNGIPAPATASELPLVALIGAVLLTVGFLIVSVDESQPREAIVAEREARRAAGGRPGA